MLRYSCNHLVPVKGRHGKGNTVCHEQSGGHHDFGEHVLDAGNILAAVDKFDNDASSCDSVFKQLTFTDRCI